MNYSQRARYTHPEVLEVRVRNTTSRPLSDVSLHLDPGFLPKTPHLSLAPASNHPCSINLGTLKPGETRAVQAEYGLAVLGRSRAVIWARASEEEKSAVLPLRFWVHP